MDKKHKKKLKRSAKKKKDKAKASAQQEKVQKQMGMFDMLPESCSACDKEFPKTREAHMSWRVVVRNEAQQVRLFCPECQDKVKELLEKDNEI